MRERVMQSSNSCRTVIAMKLVKIADEKIGLVVLLPKGEYAIDIASSLGVLSHDPLSIGLLNGVLKDGHHWSLLVNHWANLRWPLKKLENIALRTPDHPSLVLRPLTDGPGTASAANPIIAIEITGVETFEEQDPTGRRAMKLQFIQPADIQAPSNNATAEAGQVIDFLLHKRRSGAIVIRRAPSG
jgi:hypothetical protein